MAYVNSRNRDNDEFTFCWLKHQLLATILQTRFTSSGEMFTLTPWQRRPIGHVMNYSFSKA